MRYTRASKTHGIDTGEYARVVQVNDKQNLVTVKRENAEQVNYDPRRLHGVTLYRETERSFAEGDRVQFTAPNREQHIANRELGTIEEIEATATCNCVSTQAAQSSSISRTTHISTTDMP